MTKTLEDYFADWEGATFGFGYGSGEQHTIPALLAFLALCPETGNYNYEAMEKELGPTVAWLFINILCRADMIEYGTSPRFGWLTETGRRLRAFVLSKTADELISLTVRGDDYDPCLPGACNCGPLGYEKGRVCQNPFWLAEAKAREGK